MVDTNLSNPEFISIVQERKNITANIFAELQFARSVSSAFVVLSDNRTISSTRVDIVGIFSLIYNKVEQIGWSDYVSIDFNLIDFAAPQTVNLDSFEYSLDQGTTWNPGTIDPNHSSSTVTFPFSSTNNGNYTIVWNALNDLGEGKFGLVKIKMVVSAGLKQSTAITTLNFFQKFYGMGYLPPGPKVFKVVNVDDDPIPKVDLEWQPVNDADLHKNIFHFNDFFAILSDVRYVFQHQRQVIGYSLYRGNNQSFNPPTEGVQVADENVLTKSTTTYSDQTVQQGMEYFYKIATVV